MFMKCLAFEPEDRPHFDEIYFTLKFSKSYNENHWKALKLKFAKTDFNYSSLPKWTKGIFNVAEHRNRYSIH